MKWYYSTSILAVGLVDLVKAAPTVSVAGDIQARDAPTVKIDPSMCVQYGTGNVDTSLCLQEKSTSGHVYPPPVMDTCQKLATQMTGDPNKEITLPANTYTAGWQDSGKCAVYIGNFNKSPVAGGDITVNFDTVAMGKFVDTWSKKCFTGERAKAYNAVRCSIVSPQIEIWLWNGKDE